MTGQSPDGVKQGKGFTLVLIVSQLPQGNQPSLSLNPAEYLKHLLEAEEEIGMKVEASRLVKEQRSPFSDFSPSHLYISLCYVSLTAE